MGTFNTAIDKGKNFIVFYSPEGPTVKMIRWGWFEDNIISKYVGVNTSCCALPAVCV